MKIGIDISQAQYTGTGVGNYTLELAKHLAAINHDHELLFVGNSWGNYQFLKETFEPLGNTKLYRFPVQIRERVAGLFRTVPIEMLLGKVDVYHSSDWLEPKTREAKKVTTIHDLTVLLFPDHHHPVTVSTHKKRFEFVKNESAAIIADSVSTKRDIVKLLKISDSKIHVVYLAASPRYTQFARQKPTDYHKAVDQVKQKYGLKRPYLLSVGTQEPRKNLEKTIQSFLRFAPDENAGFDLVIAGKYGWGEKLSHQQPAHIKTLGFVSEDDLPALYAGCEVFIYPSLYEGFGLPVLEAMTLGAPVITTKRGSLAEVVGDAGVLVDPDSEISISNGIHRALAQKNDLAQQSLTQAKKFSWIKTAEETLKVYESIGSK